MKAPSMEKIDCRPVVWILALAPNISTISVRFCNSLDREDLSLPVGRFFAELGALGGRSCL